MIDAQEIANRIALIWNPMPDMSGQQINRLHGRMRQLVEDLAKEIADESAAMLAAERERCAAVAEEYTFQSDPSAISVHAIANAQAIAWAIRNLLPQSVEGQP